MKTWRLCGAVEAAKAFPTPLREKTIFRAVNFFAVQCVNRFAYENNQPDSPFRVPHFHCRRRLRRRLNPRGPHLDRGDAPLSSSEFHLFGVRWHRRSIVLNANNMSNSLASKSRACVGVEVTTGRLAPSSKLIWLNHYTDDPHSATGKFPLSKLGSLKPIIVYFRKLLCIGEYFKQPRIIFSPIPSDSYDCNFHDLKRLTTSRPFLILVYAPKASSRLKE